MPLSELPLASVFEALSRCMDAHPPMGTEHALYPDADRLAGLWAEMHLSNTPSVSAAAVKPAVLEAFERWRGE